MHVYAFTENLYIFKFSLKTNLVFKNSADIVLQIWIRRGKG